MPLLLDFESRSGADLAAIGGRKYWQHSSTEALCCVAFDTDDDTLIAWTPGNHEAASQIERRARDGDRARWGAHNATGFDRFAMRKEFGVDLPGWIDTSELARKAGLPGALDALGTRWLNRPKDKVASAYTKSLSRLNKAGSWLYQPEMPLVEDYCLSDVEILVDGWSRLAPWLLIEPEVVEVDRTINDRGVLFDRTLAARLLDIDAELCDRRLKEAASLAGWTLERTRQAAASPKQFAELTGLDDAQKQTVEAAIARDDLLTPAGIALCKARRALTSIARGKLEAGLNRVSAGGRLQDTLRYYGAHTGRWSGRGMQIQNLPRPEKRFEDWTHEQILQKVRAVKGGDSLPDAAHVDLLLRACLQSEKGKVLIAQDFSSIEARVLAWCARAAVTLDAFVAEKDLYKIAATSIFGTPYDDVTKPQRQAGKVAELALGYQGGHRALERMARANGVDLSSVGAKPREIVNAWRRARPDVVNLWANTEQAFLMAAHGGVVPHAGCTFAAWPDANGVAVFLPSGRPIIYNDVSLADGCTYLGTKGREHIYGGKLVENLVQGISRDLLVVVMLELERQGIPVVVTVHDEIVSEVPKADADRAQKVIAEIMSKTPEWAKRMRFVESLDVGLSVGERVMPIASDFDTLNIWERDLPIGSSGFVAERYRKL